LRGLPYKIQRRLVDLGFAETVRGGLIATEDGLLRIQLSLNENLRDWTRSDLSGSAAVDPAQQFAANMLLAGTATFRRDHPLTNAIGASLGMTAAQMDELFIAAAALWIGSVCRGAQSSTQAGSAFGGTPQGGTSAPIVKSTTQLTIVMNYIIER
jgi:hypothetical protein